MTGYLIIDDHLDALPNDYLLQRMYGPLDPPRTEIGDLGAKCAARILIQDRNSGIVVPSREEWIGLNLLERDDELPNRRR